MRTVVMNEARIPPLSCVSALISDKVLKNRNLADILLPNKMIFVILSLLVTLHTAVSAAVRQNGRCVGVYGRQQATYEKILVCIP